MTSGEASHGWRTAGAPCRCSLHDLHFHVVMSSTLPTTSCSRYYNFRFTDKKTETQRQEVICPRSHREPVLKQRLKPKSPDPWPGAPVNILLGEGPGAVVQWIEAWTLDLACLVLIPALRDTSCVTLNKLLNLSVP